MKYSNLHTHTIFSDGKNTPRETVEEALRLGMRSIGFSDHSFTPNDPSYCMHLDRYDAYAKQILSLKEEFADRIDVYLGMELDYYSEIPALPLDYKIASIHYIYENGANYAIDHSPEDQINCARDMFGGEMLGVAERYYSMLIEHARRCNPTFIGHFDVITKFSLMPEDDPRYLALSTDAMSEIVKTCPYIEVNTGAISRRRRTVPYPILPVMKHMKAIGAHPVLGADSHKNEHLTFWFDEAIEMLRDVGFRYVSVFNGKGYDEVPID